MRQIFYSFRTLNWQGRIITEYGSSELIDLYPKSISKNTVSLFAKIDDAGTVEGQMRAIKLGIKPVAIATDIIMLMKMSS